MRGSVTPVVLPHQRQPLAKFINYHDLTHEQVADALGCDRIRLRNLIAGHVYVSPDEIAKLEALFGLPIEVMFEPASLIWRDVWPPLRGAPALRHEYALRAQGVKVDPDPRFYDSQLVGFHVNEVGE